VTDDRRQALREALQSALTRTGSADRRDGRAAPTGADIQRELEREPPDEVHQRDLVASVDSVMTLDDRTVAIPALERFVGRAAAALTARRVAAPSATPVTFAEVLAATVLATFGNRAGIPVLTSVGTLTNSGIEFFYARGALIVLGEPIPPALTNRRSVFRQREELIDACLRGGQP